MPIKLCKLHYKKLVKRWGKEAIECSYGDVIIDESGCEMIPSMVKRGIKIKVTPPGGENIK